MELNLNSPAYFSKKQGVDDDIYWFFREICKYFLDKEYSEIITIIGITPIIAPQEELEKGSWKEHIKVAKSSNLAIISKQIDYITYLDANTDGRKKLMIDNILSSVKSIKTKGKFDYESFEKDLLAFVDVSNSKECGT